MLHPAEARPGMELFPPVLLPEGADEEDNELESLGGAGPSDDGVEWMLLPGANGEVHVAVLSPPPVPMANAMRMMRPTDVEFFLYTRFAH
jgi:hypothetical protein